jgi:hypothetical protein
MIADDGSSGEAPAHVADTSDSPSKGDAPPRSRWRNGSAWLAVFGVLLLTSTILTLANIERSQSIAPADGLVYVDAYNRALEGEVVRRGDTVGVAALETFLCEPSNASVVAAFAQLFPAESGDQVTECADANTATVESTAWIHPPSYFWVTAAAGSIITALAPDVSPLSAGRVVGALWFAAGGVVLVGVATLWGARRWAATGVVAAFAVTPAFVGVFSFVTPDAAFLLVSAVVCGAATLWWQRRLALGWLFAAGVFSVLFKQPHVLAAVAAVGLAPDPFAYPFDLNGVMATAFTGVTKLTFGDSPGVFLEPLAGGFLAAVVLAGLLGAAVGAVLYEERWNDMRSLAMSAVLVIGFGGALVSAFYAASGGIMLPPSPRYVWGAFAAFAIPLLVVAHRRVVLVPAVVLWGFGILAWWTFDLT